MRTLVLAVAVSSKDGDFEDSVKAFAAPTKELAEKLALAWFAPTIAEYIRNSWTCDDPEALMSICARIELATSISELEWIVAECDELENIDNYSLHVLSEALELPWPTS